MLRDEMLYTADEIPRTHMSDTDMSDDSDEYITSHNEQNNEDNIN